jgi:predicted nucleic acid-binding protein
VLDASVALSWFVDRPTSGYATRIRRAMLAGDRALVPALWESEVANGFVVAQRRGVLNATDAEEAFQALEIVLAQGIDISAVGVPLRAVVTAAMRWKLTAYDAVYLETALRQRLPLATLDHQLAAAAANAGVEILK